MIEFSDLAREAPLRYPKEIRPDDLTCNDVGPSALGVAVDGLDVRLWTFNYDGSSVWVSSEGVPPMVVLSDTDIVHIDATFDQNGTPVVVYEKDGHVWQYWFDPNLDSLTTTDLGVGAEPFTYLDWRDGDPTSNITTSYRRGTQAFYRLQLDRFSVEYSVPIPPISRLTGAAMGTNNRFIFRGLNG